MITKVRSTEAVLKDLEKNRTKLSKAGAESFRALKEYHRLDAIRVGLGQEEITLTEALMSDTETVLKALAKVRGWKVAESGAIVAEMHMSKAPAFLRRTMNGDFQFPKAQRCWASKFVEFYWRTSSTKQDDKGKTIWNKMRVEARVPRTKKSIDWLADNGFKKVAELVIEQERDRVRAMAKVSIADMKVGK